MMIESCWRLPDGIQAPAGADAAKRIAEAGDYALVWPEFVHADDADLER